MTTRGSLQRGVVQQQFQGPVHKWKRDWVSVGPNSNTASEPRLKLLKWVQQEERTHNGGVCRFPNLKPIGKVYGSSGAASQRVPDEKPSEQSPVKSGSLDQEEYLKPEDVLEGSRDDLDPRQPKKPRLEAMAFQRMPQSSDDAGFSLPGIDVSEVSYPEHSPDIGLHGIKEDEEMKDTGIDTQSLSSNFNAEDISACDMKIEQRAGDLEEASPSSFEGLQEAEAGSIQADALGTADDDLLAEDDSILEREDDAEEAGTTGSELSEESEEIDPGQVSLGSISEDDGGLSEDEENRDEAAGDILLGQGAQHNIESACLEGQELQGLQCLPDNEDGQELEMSDLHPPHSNGTPSLLDPETTPDSYNPGKLDQEEDNSSPNCQYEQAPQFKR